MRDQIISDIRSLDPSELLARIKEDAQTKEDLVAPTTSLSVTTDGKLSINGGIGRVAEMTDRAQQQIAQYLGIPTRYWDRMKSAAPDLLATNANEWIGRLTEDRRMVRLMRGRVRAILSDRYDRFDNLDAVMAIHDAIKDMPEVVPVRGWYDENGMSLSLVRQDVVEAVGGLGAMDARTHNQDTHQDLASPCATARNDETGGGASTVLVGMFSRFCCNLFLWATNVRKIHLGTKIDAEAERWLSQEARSARNRATALAMADLVRAAFTPETFAEMMKSAGNSKRLSVDEPITVLKQIAEREALHEDALLQAFMAAPEPTAWGIASAVTLLAQRTAGQDQQIQMSLLGGKLLDESASLDRFAAAVSEKAPRVMTVSAGSVLPVQYLRDSQQSAAARIRSEIRTTIAAPAVVETPILDSMLQ